jgi:signal transduction histidine kinase
MPARLRGSIRLWQTELFIVVIVVAILILSGSLSAELSTTLTRMAETSEQQNASALALRLQSSLSLGVGSTPRVHSLIAEYRNIYGGGIWVYEADGDLLASDYEATPPETLLQSALQHALADGDAYVISDLRPTGWIIAAEPIGAPGAPADWVVITASSAAEPAAVLRAVRDRLWVTFWISLAVAGLLGFGFSELMSRRIRAMSAAAAAIAGGDFDQRLSTTLVPDEIQDLAESYNRMASTLGETFDAQRRFVADASHELRTPIAAIKGMLELLDDSAKNVPEVRDDFIHTMQLETDRLGRLVADLLTLARLEAGSLGLDVAPVDVQDLLADIAGVMRTLAGQAGVKLVTSVPDGESVILADRDRLAQVLLSFTDNAIKHAPPGSSVCLTAQAADSGVRLSVSDEGPGIGADEVARVFERFYQADTARTGGGTGLGLAIAKEIVEAHGSRIDVESDRGRGTTFTFVLPKA